MKIDLHCHTKQVKSGDGKGRNVSPELFKTKIINADVKIVAITNHNTFDYDQYLTLKNVVADFCSVWPGIEIDVLGSNGKKFHLIVVANPENAIAFSHSIKNMFHGENLETCSFSLANIYSALNIHDVLYIPHFGKKPAISEEDLASLHALVGEPARIFGETSDHRSLGVFANHDYSVLIGSDIKDWEHYENSKFAELRLPVESFSQFLLLSKRDNVVVDTLRNKKHKLELLASPHRKISFPLTVYADINIIFGQKGTGKSEILNSLYQSMLNSGLTCEKYVGSEKDADFSLLLQTKDMEADITKLGIQNYEEDFHYIFNWSDGAPVLFSNYINWYKTKDHNANKSRMKITEASNLGELLPPNVEEHRADFSHIKTVNTHITKIRQISYLASDESTLLQILISKLYQGIKTQYEKDVIDKYATQLVNFSIESIKQHADNNSDTVSKPSTTGFRDFATNRIKLKKIIDRLAKAFETKAHHEREFLGELEGKGQVYINKCYRLLCSTSRTAEFKIGITNLRDIFNILFVAKEDIFSQNLQATISAFSTKCHEQNITSLTPFLGLSKQITLDNGEEYKPSNGEKGILLLQQKLREESDAYFLDEPELGMGNSYIDTTIRPLISSLAKRHKYVVVATHNANIAVRTLPYTSILRIHENGQFQTYVGNPFNDQLVNIENPNDIRSWTDESMHTLEGGYEAFYERKNIYESKNC